jgi:hypothetical protein
MSQTGGVSGGGSYSTLTAPQFLMSEAMDCAAPGAVVATLAAGRTAQFTEGESVFCLNGLHITVAPIRILTYLPCSTLGRTEHTARVPACTAVCSSR